MVIGIVHHDSNKRFLKPLLKSLKGVKYPVVVVHNEQTLNNETMKFHKSHGFPVVYNPENGFELGALALLLKWYPKENDFFLLQNSTLIKDQEIFDIAAQFDGTLALSGGLMCFMAKYRRETIERLGIPIAKDMKAEIFYEHFWNIIYLNLEEKIALCHEPLKDTDVFEEKFGRRNMVIENTYLKKWKSKFHSLDLKQYYEPK